MFFRTEACSFSERLYGCQVLSPEYLPMIRERFTEERPDLFLCMNEYEAHAPSQGLADELHQIGCAVGVLDKASHQIVLDKYAKAQQLKEHGIPNLATYLGSGTPY